MAENSDYLKEQKGTARWSHDLCAGFRSSVEAVRQAADVELLCFLLSEKEARIVKEKELGLYKERKVTESPPLCD